MKTITMVRKLGGLEVSGVVNETPQYRGQRDRIDAELDEFLLPYNKPGAKMNRHDAAMVCGAINQLVKGYGIDLAKVFTVSPPEKSAPPPHAA